MAGLFRSSLSSTATSDRGVKVKLECVGAAAFRLPVRHLMLHPGRPVIIGRASKNTNKNIQPTSDNAFFDCPVMSRNHAELIYNDSFPPQIMLQDTKSLHGSFVNDVKVNHRANLHTGDTLKFGDAVTRPEALHHGIKVRIDIDDERFVPPPSCTLRASSNTFRVPSDSGDYLGESDDQDEDDVTPSDDDDDEGGDPMSDDRTFVSFPRTKANRDSKPRSSGLSQLDPVIVEDDISIMAQTSSPPGSPGAWAEPYVDADKDSDEEEHDVEYAPNPDSADEDDASNSADCDDVSDHDDTGIEQIDDEEAFELDPADESTDLFETTMPPKEAVKIDVAKSEPPTGPIQIQQTATLFPAGRVLPNPEDLTRQTRFNNVSLPSISDQFPHYGRSPSAAFGNRYNPAPPSAHVSSMANGLGSSAYETCPVMQSSQHEQGKNMSGDSDMHDLHTKSKAVADYWRPGPYAPLAHKKPLGSWDNWAVWEAESRLSKARSNAAQPILIECGEADSNGCGGLQSNERGEVESNERIEVESKKRKRDTIDDVEDEAAENTTGPLVIDVETLLNATSPAEASQDSASIDFQMGENYEVIVPIGQDSSANGEQVGGSVGSNEEGSTAEPQRQSRIAVFKLPSLAAARRNRLAAEQATTEQATTGQRPRKKVRRSSVNFALTAAMGAVGGCVATVGFLWSPLAERLLA